jgi:hypothetical protein
MSKTPRINGRMARPYVQAKKAFTNSNNQLYAVWHTPLLYVVYSYGEHWPLFVWDGFDWYENEDKCSPTTTRHRSVVNPYTHTTKVSCAWLKTFVSTYRNNHRLMEQFQRDMGIAA